MNSRLMNCPAKTSAATGTRYGSTTDQIRLATAQSEIGRDLVANGPGGVVFALNEAPPTLEVTVTRRRQPIEGDRAAVTGLAERLARPLGDDDVALVVIPAYRRTAN